MDYLDLSVFLQSLIDEDVIKSVEAEKDYESTRTNDILHIEFNDRLKMSVVDSDGYFMSFDCDCIEYSSNRMMEFIIDEELYLSKDIREIKNIKWKVCT